MQISLAAARSSFIVVALLAIPVGAQVNAHRQTAGAQASAIKIEKTNRRPASRVQSSIEEYERLLKTTPSDAVILNNLGAMYFLSGRFFESQSMLRKAVQRDPQSLPIRVNLAIALNKTYNPGLAIKTLEGVLREDPSQDRAQQVLCEIYTQEDLKREALACYEVLWASDRMDAVSAASYSAVLLDLGNVDRALELLRWADVKFPANAGVKNGLGVALFRKKKYADAERSLQQAVELEPGASRVRYNLAVAQMATNKRGAVLEQYKYLKTSNPELAGELYKIIFRDKILSAPRQ